MNQLVKKKLSLKRERFLWIVLICLLLVFFLFFSSKASDDQQDPDIVYLQLLHHAILQIQKNYVDPDKIPYKKLAYGAIQGMLKALDDEHSYFLKTSDVKKLRESLNNSFGGLGIYIESQNEIPTVILPIEGTPAFQSGIQSGDKIVDIEGVLTRGMTLDDVIRKLKGLPGSKVSIKILREGSLDLIPLTITRAIIKTPTLRYDFIKKGIAYIRILNFGEKTTQDLQNAIAKLKKQGLQKLLIDLRNNPGGLLKVAVEVADIFINQTKIVFTRGRNPQQNESFYSSSKKTLIPPSIPIVVLVNHNSASASEIVAGAFQDTQRALIVGNKTFGKGSVQNIIPLRYPLQDSNENIAIRLTVQKYFTPSGRSIHGKGIEPDVFVPLPSKNIEQLYMEKKLNDGNYIKKFIQKYPNYSLNQFNQFINKLKINQIALNHRMIKKRIRDENYRKKNKFPIFDLQYDITLKKALEILESQPSSQQKIIRSF